eukprot:7352027-Karenia_brevis.AAC.1
MFSVQEEGALATTVKHIRSHFHAKYAGKCFLWQSLITHRGTIKGNETLAAQIVFFQKWNQHFSVECVQDDLSRSRI